ncbi:MAG TPA: DNA polymerase/3'-5' exonuclease PolX [Stellaceae bacterium]|nr:DNA polymerase/3'-5' exonuclease PolX [Stellaceae bacterium]
MPAHNSEIADALDEVADLLELEQANPFRVRAYRNAARAVRGLGTEVAALLARGAELPHISGIGKDLAGKITELARTQRLPLLKELRGHAPPIALELLHLPNLGPKRVKLLCDELDIHSMEQLHRALIDGRVRELPGFGAGLEKKLLQAIGERRQQPARFKLAAVEGFVEPLLAYLAKGPGVGRVTVAGSYRRCQETVGDIDIVATAAKGPPLTKWFTQYEEVARVSAAGDTRATVVLRSGLQVDLRIVPAESHGAALHYFTGSKAHNIAIRRMGQERGLKINEYGVFRGRHRVGGETEEEVYRAVDLPFIPPELRENRGEIEAAAAHALPQLIDLADLRGDLHAHSTATDGHNTIAEMAEAARAAGLHYIAITEHSRRLTMAHGLDPERLRRQIAEIDRLNAEKPGITVLRGIEVDILEDGKLDLPDSVLKELDLVVAAVHSRFNLSREKQTERILRAIERPCFTILAHPTGRLIGEREPYDVDMPRLIEAARQRGCFLELNAHPDRLDLTEVHCRMAKDAGVLVSIATDAHRATEFSSLRFGVGQARRGWLGPEDVLNTRPLDALRPLLRRTLR